jgi:hypothetical protein
MPQNNAPVAAPAVRRCPKCGPTARRCDTGTAVVLVGLLVGVLGGVGQVFLTRGTGPDPAGLYVAALGAAVAALWVIARAFRGAHC